MQVACYRYRVGYIQIKTQVLAFIFMRIVHVGFDGGGRNVNVL